MKSKLVIITIILAVLASTVFVSVYGEDLQTYFARVKKQEALDEELRLKQSSKLLTEEEKEEKRKIEEKVNKRLREAWNDIKDTYKIDETKYIKVEFKNFFSNQMDAFTNEFNDKEFFSQVRHNVFKHTSNLPEGATVPNLLFKKDKSEIIIAYKLKDGKNCMRRVSNNDDSWTMQEYIVKGKPIVKID